MDSLTKASNIYMDTFQSYLSQFMAWGQWIFISLLTINIVWLCLWYAFDKNSLVENMPAFIKKFFVISFFYTVMMHPNWLMQLLKTAQVMGNNLTHTPIDPSSIISEGLAICNKIIIPVQKSSILTLGFGLIIIAVVYIVVMFVFISIALELCVTLIVTTALITVATFFLGFAALSSTTQIARQTLDVILANCVKLLGIYLVVAAGSKTMAIVCQNIPTKIQSFDQYAWIVACAFLFWLTSKNLPLQLAKIVSGAVEEKRGTDAAALSMASLSYAKTGLSGLKLATNSMSGSAKIAGSTVFNAASHLEKSAQSSSNFASALTSSISGSMSHLGQSVAGNMHDHFKNVGEKLAGGRGSSVKTISERMYEKGKNLKN